MRSPIIAFSIMAATVSPTLVSAVPTSPNMNTAVTHPRITEVQQGTNPLPIRRQLGDLTSSLPVGGTPAGGGSGLGIFPDQPAAAAALPPIPQQSGTKPNANFVAADTVPYTEDAAQSIPTDPTSDAASNPLSDPSTVSNAAAVPVNAQAAPTIPKEPTEPVAANMVQAPSVAAAKRWM